MRRSRRIGLIGAPSSAGAYAPGQEQAPGALRAAGLVRRLEEAGLTVADRGDVPGFRWRPDRERPFAQNLERVVATARAVADRVSDVLAGDDLALVLGGDCTVGIGTVAGHVATGERVGLVYFDLHADLNVPDSVPPGALDWMGVAHMLGESGARPELVRVGPSAPLLEPERLVLVGWGPEEAQPGERETIERERIEAVTVDEVRADPEGAAARALEGIQGRVDRLVIHFDVDVIDFTDTPLSENPGRNEGVAYANAMRALAVLLGASSFAGLTVTELNPDHAEEGAGSIDRLARDLARALAAR